jgi:hypothetical protein
MIYAIIAVFLMVAVEAVIIIPDRIPVVRTIRKKVMEHDRSNGSG